MGFKHISIVLVLLVFLASFAFATWDCTGVPGRVEYRFDKPTYCSTYGLGTEASEAKCTYGVSLAVWHALGDPRRCAMKVYCDDYKENGKYVVAGCVKYAPECQNVCPTQCLCKPLSTETAACGLCGTMTHACSLYGDSWGSWGSCTGQGVCSPSQAQSQGCGNCGTQVRTCDGSCGWGAWGSCNNQGACSPGQNETRNCPTGTGTQTRTCGSSCQWGSWTGNCGACTPGQTQNQACGNCGTKVKTCLPNGQWGDWGSCTGEGVCAPGQGQWQYCDLPWDPDGECGVQERICTGNCGWGAWGPCMPNVGQGSDVNTGSKTAMAVNSSQVVSHKYPSCTSPDAPKGPGPYPMVTQVIPKISPAPIVETVIPVPIIEPVIPAPIVEPVIPAPIIEPVSPKLVIKPIVKSKKLTIRGYIRLRFPKR